jgi:GT2 family glycosyltransferase
MRSSVAIIYLAYHSDEYIDDFLCSLEKMTYPKELVDVVIVDNYHPEYGSGEEKIRAVLDSSVYLHRLPRVHLLPQSENLGFAGGNNVGVRWALSRGVDYVIFHNDDGYFAPEAVERLIIAMESDRSIGIAQALLLLDSDKELVNTSGNSFHYLGFGLCDNYRERRDTLPESGIADISYASGAGMIVSREIIEKYGSWDEDFFMYHEDMEWSLRLSVLKMRVVVVYDAIFYHKYNFSKSVSKFYFMERNRFAVLLMFFRLPTLILMLPMLTILELGMFLFSLRSGTLHTRLAVYQYWLRPSSWRTWLSKRRKIMEMRKITDKSLLERSVGEILFQEKVMNSSLLTHVGNPVMSLYRRFLLWLVWW